MDRFVKLAIVAVVIYFGVTAVLPWAKKELGGGGGRRDFGGGGVGGGCITSAQAASRDFGAGLRQFSMPPIDVESWESFEQQQRRLLYDADDACSCPEESCEKARTALDELRSILSDFDSGFRGQQPVPFNAARDLQRVDRLLAEAERMAVSGG